MQSTCAQPRCECVELTESRPEVRKRFQDLDIHPDMFLLTWFLTLFAKSVNIDLVGGCLCASHR